MDMYWAAIWAGLAAIVLGGILLQVFGAVEDSMERAARRRRLSQ